MNRKVKILEGLLIGILAITKTGAGATNNVAAPAPAASTVDSQDYDVKRFLEEAPPLRKIIYGVDGNYFIHNGKQLGGIIYYEGAIQGDTFYQHAIEKTEKLPGAVKIPNQKNFVSGRASEGVSWTIDYGSFSEGLISTSGETNAASSGIIKTADMSYRGLNAARSLWISFVVPGTFRWIDENHFESKIEGPSELVGTNDTYKVLTGKIVEKDTEGRPTRIEYRWPVMLETEKYWKEFIYSSPVGKTKLPSMVIGGKLKTDSETASAPTIQTNILWDIVIGNDTDLNTRGYLPSMFLLTQGTNKPNPLVVYETNKTHFIVGKDGKLKPMGLPEGTGISRSSKCWSAAFVALILLIPFFWKFKTIISKKINKLYEE